MHIIAASQVIVEPAPGRIVGVLLHKVADELQSSAQVIIACDSRAVSACNIKRQARRGMRRQSRRGAADAVALGHLGGGPQLSEHARAVLIWLCRRACCACAACAARGGPVGGQAAGEPAA